MQYYIKPLERLKDDQVSKDSIVNKVHDYLHIDDNDIFNDPYEKDDEFDFDGSYNDNYASLPPTVDTIRLFSPNTNVAAVEQQPDQHEREDYISTVRKTRPLPKIPDRSSSKEISKDMTLILTESLKNQNRVSAQQLFQMLSKSKLNQEIQSDEDEEEPQEQDDIGGVYSLKTQVSSLRLSSKDVLNEYYQFGSKKLMTPVEEVDEEVEFFNEEDQPLQRSNRSSESSLSPPSLTSGRTSPSSPRRSLEITNNASNYGNSDITNLSDSFIEQQEQNNSAVEDLVDDEDENNEFTSPYQSFKHAPPMQNFRYSLSSDDSNEDSLYSDVHRLAIQNQESRMLNNTSNVSLPTTYSAAVDTANGHSEFSITSSGITHDKEAIKTFRRMATKTNDRHIQFNYAKHLIKLVSSYTSSAVLDSETIATRTRLQEEAEYWIEKLAKSNYAQALYIKGQWHRQCGDKKVKDIFVGAQFKKVDHDKAFKCFQQAAKYGSVEAYYELAEYWMVRKDYKKSVSFYKYAASKNHIPSLYKLANIMLRGLLQQKKNVAQGLVYLRQAADSKKPECALSAYDYACIISGDLESIDLESDPMIVDVCNKNDFRTAIHYLRIADEFGFINAAFRLGEIYKNGEKGTHIDLWKAYHFFAKAANHNHEGAMIEVSKLYKAGIPGCLKAQPSLAFQWCLRAANNGNEVAEYLIGTYCEEGVGVYPDYNQALAWYKKAASKEYGPAQERVNPSAKTTRHQYVNEKNINNKRYYQQSIRNTEEKARNSGENCHIM